MYIFHVSCIGCIAFTEKAKRVSEGVGPAHLQVKERTIQVRFNEDNPGIPEVYYPADNIHHHYT